MCHAELVEAKESKTMNNFIQNILVFSALGAALIFLVRKFIMKPNQKSTKSCGTNDDCGCH